MAPAPEKTPLTSNQKYSPSHKNIDQNTSSHPPSNTPIALDSTPQSQNALIPDPTGTLEAHATVGKYRSLDEHTSLSDTSEAFTELNDTQSDASEAYKDFNEPTIHSNLPRHTGQAKHKMNEGTRAT